MKAGHEPAFLCLQAPSLLAPKKHAPLTHYLTHTKVPG